MAEDLDNGIFISDEPEVVEVVEDINSATQALVKAQQAIEDAKRWATSNTVVDPGNSIDLPLYSSKYYSEKAFSYLSDFEKQKQTLQYSSDQLNATLELVTRLANEAQGIAIRPGIYSARHYYESTREINNIAYENLDAIGKLSNSVLEVKTEIDASASLAQKWAINEVNVAIKPGLYSAYHYAMKSYDYFQDITAKASVITNGLANLNSALSTVDQQARDTAANYQGVKNIADPLLAAAASIDSNKTAAATSAQNAKTSESNADSSAKLAQQYASGVDPVVQKKMQTAVYLFNSLTYL